MIFEKTLTSKAVIKKQKSYEFKEFSEEELKAGKKHTFENPLYLNKDKVVYELYNDDGRLAIVMLHSWDKFKEIIPKTYECNKCGILITSTSIPKNCSCGNKFGFLEK